jgi:hypothetical protein
MRTTAPGSIGCAALGLERKRYAEQRNENDRDQPGRENGDAHHREDREGVFAPSVLTGNFLWASDVWHPLVNLLFSAKHLPDGLNPNGSSPGNAGGYLRYGSLIHLALSFPIA